MRKNSPSAFSDTTWLKKTQRRVGRKPLGGGRKLLARMADASTIRLDLTVSREVRFQSRASLDDCLTVVGDMCANLRQQEIRTNDLGAFLFFFAPLLGRAPPFCGGMEG
jgi:hypothetical protein